MPTDLNDQTGLYELQTTQSAQFSGLYRVITVEHNFSDGRYTNILNLTRFNNQGVTISNPIPTAQMVSRNGETAVTTNREAYRMAAFNNSFSKPIENLTSIGKKFVSLASKIKGFLS
tara:strand:+ start:57 stop:407 length:351 start_codon:yes stop_codon:yes gene_type:complete